MNEKKWTGERLETFVQTVNTIEHLHRYAIACSIAGNLDVLDIASGEGYGSNLLSDVAKTVMGIDISKETVELAKNKYKKNNLAFKEGSAANIPLPNNSVDLIVSFETIEHHNQHEEMLNEIKRILRPNGILLMSSPDKKNYTDIPKYNNPFHVKELYLNEFKDLIKRHFTQTNFFLQKVISGSFIMHENKPEGYMQFKGDYKKFLSENNFDGLYNICLASNSILPNITSSLFDGSYINNTMLENARTNAIKLTKSTWSYKIGNCLLMPLKIFKKS